MSTRARLRPIERVDESWLVTFVDAYSVQARTGAQPGTAVTSSEADASQPTVARRVPRADRERVATRLWNVFGPGGDRAGALEALVRDADLRPVVKPDGTMGWATDVIDPTTRFIAACCATVLAIVTSRGWAALGVCGADDCEDVHLAPARGRPRRFCSTTCLNRSKARDHRARGRRPLARAARPEEDR